MSKYEAKEKELGVDEKFFGEVMMRAVDYLSSYFTRMREVYEGLDEVDLDFETSRDLLAHTGPMKSGSGLQCAAWLDLEPHMFYVKVHYPADTGIIFVDVAVPKATQQMLVKLLPHETSDDLKDTIQSAIEDATEGVVSYDPRGIFGGYLASHFRKKG
jgi:hypothetical protein